MANATLMLLLLAQTSAAPQEVEIDKDWYQSNTPTAFIESLVDAESKTVSLQLSKMFRVLDEDDDKVLTSEEISSSGVSMEWQQWLRNADENDDRRVNFSPEFITRTGCLLYTSPSPRDATLSRMPSSA